MCTGLVALPAQLLTASRAVAAETNGTYDCTPPSGNASPLTDRVSVTSSGGSTSDGGFGFDPSLSADGNYVSFTSTSAQHISGLAGTDTNGKMDIFLRDRVAGTTKRISEGSSSPTVPGNVQANGDSTASSVSSDGKWVAFQSSASNLIGGDGDYATSFSPVAPTTPVGAVADGRVQMIDGALQGATTLTVEAWFKTAGYGPIVTMQDQAYSGTPTQRDPVIYVGSDGKLRGQFWNGTANPITTTGTVNDNKWHHVALTGAGTSQFLYLDGVKINATALSGTINQLAMTKNYVGFGQTSPSWTNTWTGWRSFDGRIDEVAVYRSALTQTAVQTHFNARRSSATSYAAAVNASAPYLYLRLGETTGTTATDASANNRTGNTYAGTTYSVGEKGALTLDDNDVEDVFLRDVVGNKTTRLSVATTGAQAFYDALNPVISGDGNTVAFYTQAALEQPTQGAGITDTNGVLDVYTWNRNMVPQIERESVAEEAATGTIAQVTKDSKFEAMSSDGNYIVFSSFANDLNPNLVTNTNLHIFLHSRSGNYTTLISKNPGGTSADGDSYYPTIAADGRSIAFYSNATNLTPIADTNGKFDVYMRTLRGGVLTMTRVSRRPGGFETNADSAWPSVSADGDTVVYQSSDDQIAAGDTNIGNDVFAYSFKTGGTDRVSLTKDNATPNGASLTGSPGVVSANGRLVAFNSAASNLVLNDTNGINDVFVRDRSAKSPDLSPALAAVPSPAAPFAQSDQFGLEQHMPFATQSLGNGTGYVNLLNGNFVAQYEDASIPGVGLNTVLRRTYNSGRDDAAAFGSTGVGLGWTLSLGDVTAGAEAADDVFAGFDLNTKLDIRPIVSDLGVLTGQLLEFTDGDGTTHVFVRNGLACSHWTSPAGISLKVLEKWGSNPLAPDEYQLVRPDGVTYHATQIARPLGLPDWRVTSITDRNGNALTLEYTETSTGTSLFSPGPSQLRLTGVRHNRYPSQKVVDLHYDAQGELDTITSLPGLYSVDPGSPNQTPVLQERITKLQVDPQTDQLQWVTDQQGDHLSTSFGYPDAAHMTITDPRGHATTIETAGSGITKRLSKIVDRQGKNWTYSYSAPDQNGVVTTSETAPVDATHTAVTTYKVSPLALGSDGRLAGGNITSITDQGSPNPIVTNYGWTANRLTSVTDAYNKVTSYEYNDLGLLTKITRPAPNASNGGEAGAPTSSITTDLSYTFPPQYGQTNAQCPAISIPNSNGAVSTTGWCFTVAQLNRVLMNGADSSTRRMTDFVADNTTGNLMRMTQRANPNPDNLPFDNPAGAGDRQTSFTYYGRGSLQSVDGPRTDVIDGTTYGDGTGDANYGNYDRTGLPQKVTDANGKSQLFGYTPYGMLGKTTDRNGNITTATFDERDNVVSTTDPSLNTTRFSYDGNNNKTKTTKPSQGNRFTAVCYDNNDRLDAV